MRGNRSRWLLVAGMALALAAAGCTSAESKSGGSKVIMVSLKEFSISPAQIAVPAAEAFELHVMNQGQAEHSFAVDTGGGVVETPALRAGGTAFLKVPALKAGTYSAWCTVAGHKEAGMTGVLVAAAGGSTGHSMGGKAASHMTGDQMAQAHKASTLAFPETTVGVGGRVLKPNRDGRVKVFGLVARRVKWEVSKGVYQDAYTYNGTVPGPELRVHQGDRIRVVLDNQLPEPTVVHFHGLTVPNKMDGVPYVTQDPVMPGRYFVYEFTVKDPPGTYMYHSHFNSADQVGKGLYGAIVVEPRTKAWEAEYTEFLGDGPLGYTINGKSFPATAPLSAKRGDRVLIRLLNAGEMLHPFHLHGYHFDVISEDGTTLRNPYSADTLVVAPGERFDVLVKAVNPGVWAFHCHILSHVEGPQGMFGMVTALVVE